MKIFRFRKFYIKNQLFFWWSRGESNPRPRTANIEASTCLACDSVFACNVPTGRAVAGYPHKSSGKCLRGGWHFPILYVFRPVSAYRQAEVDVAAAIRQRSLIRVRELLLFGFLRSILLRPADPA